VKRYLPLPLLTLLLVLFALPTIAQAAPAAAPALSKKPTIPHLALRDAGTEEDDEFDGEAEEIEIEECEAAEGSFEFDDEEEEFEEVEEDEEFEGGVEEIEIEKAVFLVHGEHEQSDLFAGLLRSQFGLDVVCPVPGDSFEIG